MSDDVTKHDMWDVEITTCDLAASRVHRFRYASREEAESAAEPVVAAMLANEKFKNDAPDEVRVSDDCGWGSFPGKSVKAVRVLNSTGFIRKSCNEERLLRSEFPDLYVARGAEPKDAEPPQ